MARPLSPVSAAIRSFKYLEKSSAEKSEIEINFLKYLRMKGIDPNYKSITSQDISIFSCASLYCDFDAKKADGTSYCSIEIANKKELAENFRDFGFKTGEDFHKAFKLLYDYLNHLFNFMLIYVFRLKTYNQFKDIKISKPPANLAKAYPEKDDRKYYAYSHFRLNRDELLSLFDKLYAVVKSVIMNGVIKRMVEAATKDKGVDKIFEILPAKLRTMGGDLGVHLRDSGVSVAGNFLQVHPNIIEIIDVDTIGDRRAAKSDFSAIGIESLENIPFEIQGGNIVVGNLQDKRKIMLIAISEKYFCKKDYLSDMNLSDMMFDVRDFLAFYVNENGENAVSRNYKEFCEEVVKPWARKYVDEVVIVDRVKLSETVDYEDVYHLDVFCNIVDNVLILPSDKLITEQSRMQLTEIFGKENIILISKEERKSLCSNFIVVDNDKVLMSSVKTPQSFVRKLNDKVFTVLIPPIILGTDKDNGLRCRVQEFSFSKAMDDDAKEVMSDRENASKFAIKHYQNPPVYDRVSFPRPSIAFKKSIEALQEKFETQQQ